MTKEEAKKMGATHYIKKPFRRIRYLHCHDGIYWYLSENVAPLEMCREWILWIKPL